MPCINIVVDVGSIGEVVSVDNASLVYCWQVCHRLLSVVILLGGRVCGMTVPRVPLSDCANQRRRAAAAHFSQKVPELGCMHGCHLHRMMPLQFAHTLQTRELFQHAIDCMGSSYVVV